MPRAARCNTVNWNWLEFLHDDAVGAMSPRALGLYVRLLGAAGLAGEPGWIKGDGSRMKRESGATDDEWRECGGTVLARFPLHSRFVAFDPSRLLCQCRRSQ